MAAVELKFNFGDGKRVICEGDKSLHINKGMDRTFCGKTWTTPLTIGNGIGYPMCEMCVRLSTRGPFGDSKKEEPRPIPF